MSESGNEYQEDHLICYTQKLYLCIQSSIIPFLALMVAVCKKNIFKKCTQGTRLGLTQLWSLVVLTRNKYLIRKPLPTAFDNLIYSSKKLAVVLGRKLHTRTTYDAPSWLHTCSM